MARTTALLVVLLLGATVAAAASEHKTWGRHYHPDGHPPQSERSDQTCVASVAMYVWSAAGTGVTQLKVRFNLQAPFSSSLPLHYQSTGWIVSAEFDDDAFYQQLFPAQINHPPGGQYVMTADVRGVRKSWWRLDRKHKDSLDPTIGCETGPSLTG